MEDEISQIPAENEAGSEEMSFADLGLDEITLAAIEKKGFVNPSPIQMLAIPRLLNGESNVIARARTGTGKTAAFGLPLVQSLREESSTVKAIILEPTRELAMQTATEMASFTTGRFPRTAVVYGGASMGEQIRSLKKGVEIVVGTPGRVQDLIDRGVLDISKIEYFILDEGDEMLDMGFVDDIENIFAKANPDCRVLLFSATIPAPILKIAQKFMGEYEIVEEEGHDEEPLLIEQKYWTVRENEKIEALVRLIDISPDFFGLVFVQKKTDADYVSKTLDEKGYEAAALHGDIPQGQREKILSRFRAKKTRILVATDVAARGIDIEGLTHVVNYELPFDGPTYVHRIGRTGRAGSSGVAITFVRPEERRRLQFLRNAVRRSAKGEMTEGKIPTVEEVIEVKKSRLIEEVKTKIGFNRPQSEVEDKDIDEEIIPLDIADEVPTVESVTSTPAPLYKGDPIFDQLAQELCANNDAQEVLASLLAATYGNSISKKRYGKINSYSMGGKDGKNSRDRGDRGRDRGPAVRADQIRIYVQMGWHDGYNPRKIADFFSSLLHIPGKQVDAIDMADKFCLLSLPTEAGKKAIDMSKDNPKLPHMHQDTRSSGSDSADRSHGPDHSSRSRGNFGGDKYKSFKGSRSDRGDRRDGGRRDFGSKSKGGSHTRPNVHTATKRNSQAALYKKSANAEEF